MASVVGQSESNCSSAASVAITYSSSSSQDICMVRNNATSQAYTNLAVCCSTNGTAVNVTADGCWSYCQFPYDQQAYFQSCVGDTTGQESLCIKAGGNATSVPVHSGASIEGFERAKRPVVLGLIVVGLLLFS